MQRKLDQVSMPFLVNRTLAAMKNFRQFKSSHWEHYLFVVPFVLRDCMAPDHFTLLAHLAGVVAQLFFSVTEEAISVCEEVPHRFRFLHMKM